MHDEVAVRRGHGVAAVVQEAEPLVDAEAVRAAVARDRLAFDELHHEVGPSVLGGSSVEEPRDVRMLEPREDAPLAREPGEHFVRRHSAAQQLDRDALLEEPVRALGQEDLAHAAPPETAEDTVRPDPLGRRRFVGRDPQTLEEPAGDGDGRRLEEAPGLRVRREEPLDPFREIAVRETGQTGQALGG